MAQVCGQEEVPKVTDGNNLELVRVFFGRNACGEKAALVEISPHQHNNRHDWI